jgi:hypothetical protein
MKNNLSVVNETSKIFPKNITSKLTFQLEKCQAILVSFFLLTFGHAWN